MLNKFLKITYSIIFLATVAAPSNAYAFDGPIETKNQFPLFSQLNSFSFERAGLENSNAINFSYSSVYFIKQSAEWQMSLDMELAELNMRAKRTFEDSLELGIEVPFVSFNAGFMDGAINKLHGLFGFGSYSQQDRPKNEFLYEVKRNGVTIVKGESEHAGLADIRLSAKKGLISSDPVMSVRLGLELPTGDAKRGYGSGNAGADLSLLLDKRLGESYMAYCNLGVADPGDLDGYEKVKMRHFAFGGIAFEMAATDNLNLLAQWNYQTSPYPETKIRSVDAVVVQFAFGARFIGENGGSYDFTLTEDPNTAGAPDFTIGLSYKKKF